MVGLVGDLGDFLLQVGFGVKQLLGLLLEFLGLGFLEEDVFV